MAYRTAIHGAVLLCLAGLFMAGCGQDPKSGRGLVLPEGDPQAGEEAFVRLHCNDCHQVAGREDLRTRVEPLMTVTIGGKTTRISTYGELVTSVINPSHKISRYYRTAPYSKEGVSEMRNYNEILTVAQLSDLVAFLQDQYELEAYAGPSYISYYPSEKATGK
jgi:cytochrome c2